MHSDLYDEHCVAVLRFRDHSAHLNQNTLSFLRCVFERDMLRPVETGELRAAKLEVCEFCRGPVHVHRTS